jgi:hypothetical protein
MDKIQGVTNVRTRRDQHNKAVTACVGIVYAATAEQRVRVSWMRSPSTLGVNGLTT